MEFGGDNYEDFFDKLRSHTGGPRNLRQIFDDDEMPLQYESNSLRYQPQRSGQQQQQQQQQPQSKQQTEKKTKSTSHNEKRQHSTAPATTSASKGEPRWTSILAKVASGYRGTDKIGRVGIALMINESDPTEYKLIIYKSKTLIMSTLLLKPNTKTPNVILKESYIQYYDDGQHFWSIRLESLADEQEFIKTIVKRGLPIEQVPSNASNSSPNANANTTSTSRKKHNATSTTEKLEKLAASVPQPQPRPRQPKRPKSPQAESEEEVDDVIVTPVPQAIACTEFLPIKKTTTTTTLALATNPQDEVPNHIHPNATADKLDIYLVEQRATGHVMEKKIDSILQAMSRLTTGNNSNGGSAGSSSNFSGAGDTIANSSSLAANDKEDELLELEQKLLNFKKENRALMKTLQAKEQALNDLRSSTCALCEELLAQNRELKQQNTSLLAGMTQLRNQQITNATTSSPSASPSCQQCEQSTEKIMKLERRLLAMQNRIEGAPY
ncbi:LOW QUALITY PROTEIN: uncharacterized protein [Drosophila tropicalis]|uniref:LOW QUALITY PROTEIN: uncharacterized protein n=1 Tax=Drosophila tropicalis TaxID=46794 RepID=UPI0035AC27B1